MSLYNKKYQFVNWIVPYTKKYFPHNPITKSKANKMSIAQLAKLYKELPMKVLNKHAK